MAGWSTDFLAYVSVSDTLGRTLFATDEDFLDMEGFLPPLTNSIFKIIEEGPIHAHMPQPIPRCEECEKESDK